MSGRYGYRRGASAPRPRWMTLRYAAPCNVCGETIAAGSTGYYWGGGAGITCTSINCARVHHLTREAWHGSPTTGRWVEVLAEQPIGNYRPLVDVTPDDRHHTRHAGWVS